MKKVLINVFLCVMISISGWASSIERLSEWGAGEYKDVFVKGNYAYCAADSGGLDIIDIRNPASPRKTGGVNTVGRALALFVQGNIAYVADGANGLLIIDVSNVFSPVQIGHYGATQSANGIFADGHHVYMTDSGLGFMIFDISNPGSPSLVGEYAMDYARNIIVRDNLAYVASEYGMRIVDISDPSDLKLISVYDVPGYAKDFDLQGDFLYWANFEDGLRVLDISNPFKPQLAGQLSTSRLPLDIRVKGNYAYITDGDGMVVVDISDPTAMTELADYDPATGSPLSLFIYNNKIYTADWQNGLQIIDISDPASPSFLGKYDASGYAYEVRSNGNYLYVAYGESGLQILDASDPAKLKWVASYDTSSLCRTVEVVGPYAYVGDDEDGLIILDVSDPSVPRFLGSVETPGNPLGFFAGGNYVYVAVGDPGIVIIDVSDPTKPKQIGALDYDGIAVNLWASGNYLYIADNILGFVVMDISDPSAPSIVSTYDGFQYGTDLFIYGNTAYVGAIFDGLFVLDISDPSDVKLLGSKTTDGWVMGIAYYYSDYIYLADGLSGLRIMDIYDPANIGTSTSHDTPGFAHSVCLFNNLIAVADGGSGKVHVFQQQYNSIKKPEISLSRQEVLFTTDNGGANTGAQSVRIENSGGGTLNWTAATEADWLKCSPTFGVNSGEVFLSVNGTGFAPGEYTSRLVINSEWADNSPAEVLVTLRVYQPGQTAQPFGEFATPLNGSTVSSSVPFTGWVLDDIGVLSVKLYREDGNNPLVYIGDAVFVEGARPDVAETYPSYPNNTRAGWGYMMLTNFLPASNGTFTIHAIATDTEGHQITLGTKTITVDNTNAIKPFGAIDTPTQGGTASGNNFVNFGWVLTPQPNEIPTDGSTITVWIDGVAVGHPVYNQYRGDIASLFPNYVNSNGAVGYYVLDTTSYTNGVHTIQWTAKDSAGNSDGIGSRYFTVKNTVYRQSSENPQTQKSTQSSTLNIPSKDLKGLERSFSPVAVRTGYDLNAPKRIVVPDQSGVIRIELKELERLELDFQGPVQMGSTLPIGSTLDKVKGIFCWQPGAGFMGKYRFWFLAKERRNKEYWELTIVYATITSKCS